MDADIGALGVLSLGRGGSSWLGGACWSSGLAVCRCWDGEVIVLVVDKVFVLGCRHLIMANRATEAAGKQNMSAGMHGKKQMKTLGGFFCICTSQD